MLVNALQSIRGQSRLDLVKEIVISENSSDLQSEIVAERFSRELPVRFIRQPSELTADEHFTALSTCVDSEYVALIGDDDMWDRYHLEEAERAFNNHPDIVAYFGQTVTVANETCYPMGSIGASLIQVPATSDRSLQDFSIWDKRKTAMQCMSHTPVNIWALVAEAETFKPAFQYAFGQSRFKAAPSCDKVFIWELAKHGDIALGRHIALFYRRHSEATMDAIFADSLVNAEKFDLEVTMEIANEATAFGIDAPQDWRNTYELAVSKYGLSGLIRPWNSRVSEFLLSTTKQDSPKANHPRKRYLNSCLYLITPPLFLWVWRKLRAFGDRFSP
jgi:hypothetical protein